MSNYWQRALQHRIGRRRAIATTGAFGAAAAFLAACGGSDNNNSSSSGGTGATGATGGKGQSGLLFQPTDQLDQAIMGGKYVDSHPLVLVTMDPMKSGGQIRVARRGYSQLFRVTDGVNQQSDGTIDGDLAQSFELSPDKLTLTAKLDPGAGLPPIPPVNGRTMDADDVVYSWNRLQTEGVLRTELVNSANAAAPISSITAPDKQTVVVKLAQPDVTIFPALASDVLGGLYVIPKEGDGGFDIARTAIGSGPFYMTGGGSEVMYNWKKNPNFKRTKLTKGEPFIDEISEPVVTDLATGTSQFRAGALYEYPVPALEVVGTKKDIPELLMQATPPTTFDERLFFGQAEGSPFKDERVRQALMKILDRDAFIAVAYNTDNFAKEGLPVTAFWEGAIFANTYKGWYLNPQDPSFGPNADNYKYDPDAAKKLLSAAGHDTLAFDMTYGAPSPTSFPPSYYTRAEVFLGMIESSQIFKMSRKLIDYKTEWSTERYRFSLGNFDGMTWGPDTSSNEATLGMFFVYNSKGGYYMGGDATLDDLTAKARQEFDTSKRMDLIHQVQQYDAGKMYNEKIGVGGGFQ
ncbi:MAG TPA: ABC transporter substrate-binding protein, partial [Dehalococcoidia bacterium]|nr:ABC transporter substrate-binding protein [Dehalococcoidia bacterium]